MLKVLYKKEIQDIKQIWNFNIRFFCFSTELRNEFLSQSLDSVEINTDYSRYENFVNFSSIEKRIRNFKLKQKTLRVTK